MTSERDVQVHEQPHEQVQRWAALWLASTRDHAVIFLRPDGVIEAWAGAAQRLFGYPAEIAIGLPFSVIFTPQDRALGLDAHELELARRSGRSEDDRWHVRQDGSEFWASGVLEALRDRDGLLLALCKTVRDRTDIRTQILALQNQVAAQREQLRGQQQFAACVAHELRNPLTPLLSAVTVLKKTPEAALRERAFDIVERQFEILKTLVDDLSGAVHRASHRAGYGSARQTECSAPGAVLALPLAARPVSVQAMLTAAAHSLEPLALAQNKTLRRVLPPVAIWVAADPVRLEQMLLNLVGNAIKYTSPGGCISLSATVEGDMAVMRVEDDGIGIAADMLPRIFELFTREGRAAQVPGSGVGLAVVKELARQHGGNVEARSPGAGKGSLFALRLPLSAPP